MRILSLLVLTFLGCIAMAPPSPSGQPSVSPSTSPTATGSTTPIPQLLTPPAGWKPQDVTFNTGPLKKDQAWVNPNHDSAIISGHLDVPSLSGPDLDKIEALMRKRMIAMAGAQGVGPSTRVKICNGKQDGVLTKMTLPKVTQEIMLAVSDRAYVAEYVRRNSVAEDPAATRSLSTLCAP